MYLCAVCCTVYLAAAAAALSVLSGRLSFLDFISNNYSAVIYRCDFFITSLLCVFVCFLLFAYFPYVCALSL